MLTTQTNVLHIMLLGTCNAYGGRYILNTSNDDIAVN